MQITSDLQAIPTFYALYWEFDKDGSPKKIKSIFLMKWKSGEESYFTNCKTATTDRRVLITNLEIRSVNAGYINAHALSYAGQSGFVQVVFSSSKTDINFAKNDEVGDVGVFLVQDEGTFVQAECAADGSFDLSNSAKAPKYYYDKIIGEAKEKETDYKIYGCPLVNSLASDDMLMVQSADKINSMGHSIVGWGTDTDVKFDVNYF